MSFFLQSHSFIFVLNNENETNTIVTMYILKFRKDLLLMSSLLFALSLLFSCKKDSPEPTQGSSSTLVESILTFKHKVDGQPIDFDTVKYTNFFGNTFSVETLRYFISNVMLINSLGETINIQDVIYVDAREEEHSQFKLITTIPNGNYTAMRFTFGLDSVMNQTGLFNNFPEAAMEWPMMMGGGYHYMKLEGRCEIEDSYNHFNFHTGPLNKNKNYFNVEIPMNLDVANGSFDVALVMEIQNWFQNPNTFDLTTISQGMMGDQVKQQLVK